MMCPDCHSENTKLNSPATKENFACWECLNCHSVGTEAQLAKWINTSNPSRSTFYSYISNGSMPPSGSSPSAEIEALVLQYVTDFANR